MPDYHKLMTAPSTQQPCGVSHSPSTAISSRSIRKRARTGSTCMIECFVTRQLISTLISTNLAHSSRVRCQWSWWLEVARRCCGKCIQGCSRPTYHVPAASQCGTILQPFWWHYGWAHVCDYQSLSWWWRDFHSHWIRVRSFRACPHCQCRPRYSFPSSESSKALLWATVWQWTPRGRTNQKGHLRMLHSAVELLFHLTHDFWRALSNRMQQRGIWL